MWSYVHFQGIYLFSEMVRRENVKHTRTMYTQNKRQSFGITQRVFWVAFCQLLHFITKYSTL